MSIDATESRGRERERARKKAEQLKNSNNEDDNDDDEKSHITYNFTNFVYIIVCVTSLFIKAIILDCRVIHDLN